jgi:copper chaperone CopZ
VIWVGEQGADLVVGARPHYEIPMAIDVSIRGMTCGGCVASLKRVLAREGLEAVTVELGVAHVPDDAVADLDRVKQAIAKAGFEVAS